MADFIREHCAEEVLGYYQNIARQFEAVLEPKLAAAPSVRESRLVKLAVHTFDPYGVDGAPRPAVGLIHKSKSLSNNGRFPPGVFSSMFPARLGALTADRLLKSSITCALEKNYIAEMSDYPYAVADGGVEMRVQVWLWFKYLKSCFERDEDKTTERLRRDYAAGYDLFWESASAGAATAAGRDLLAYLDQRAEPQGTPRASREARVVHEAVGGYLRKEAAKAKGGGPDPGIVLRYQYDAYRPSCLVIEVRKDVVYKGRWKTVGEQRVFECERERTDVIDEIGSSIAERHLQSQREVDGRSLGSSFDEVGDAWPSLLPAWIPNGRHPVGPWIEHLGGA